MVKITAVILAAVGAAPFAAAINCQTGLSYCGYNLLNIGNYSPQVNQALINANQPTDNAPTHQSLFQCNGGENGDIIFRAYCTNGCIDGGSGQSDSCS